LKAFLKKNPMKKTLEIVCEGKESSFQVRKLERSKLYGSRCRIPIDTQGRECSFAFLTRDGRYILPSGSTALLYLDRQGDVVERSQLQTINQEGKTISNGNANPDEVLEIGETVLVTDLLDFTVTHAYSLEPVFLSPALEILLTKGIIFRLPLPLSNGASCREAFLLGNDIGYFALFGNRTGFDFIGLPEADFSPPDSEDDFDGYDDLNFIMW